MTTIPTVRAARQTDAEALQSLYRQLVDDENVNVTPSQIRVLEEDARTRLFVCESGGEVRGTILVSLCARAMYAGRPFAVFENLLVDEEFRGNGIGRALLREAERFCLSRNCSKMMLLSSTSRLAAHQLFEQVGFEGDRKRAFVKCRRQFAEGLSPPSLIGQGWVET